jgi:predicted nucleic acid-binding protein
VIEEAVDRNVDLVLLEPTLIEFSRILVEKLGFDTRRLEEALALLNDVAAGFQASPDQTPESLTGDPDDDLILECAVTAGVEILVSGDRKHLLPVRERGGVRILTPQAFLAELRAS